MKCNFCGQEFGKGEKCQHCGADKVAALGEFEGFSTTHQGASHAASSSQTASIHREVTASTQICWKCNEIIPADALYCPVCRTRLERECPKCRKPYSSQYDNCPYCGTNFFEYEKERTILDEERRRNEQKEEAERENQAREEQELREKQQRRQEMADAINRREIEHKKIPIRVNTASRILCLFVAFALFAVGAIAIGFLCSLVLFPEPPASPQYGQAPEGHSHSLIAIILSGVFVVLFSRRLNANWRKKKEANIEQYLFWRRYHKYEKRILSIDGNQSSLSFEDREGKGMARFIPATASLRVVEDSYFIIRSQKRQIKEIQFVFDDLLSNHSLQCDSGNLRNGLWTGLASEIKFKTLSSVDIASITIYYAE